MQFDYVAFDHAGTLHRGALEAPDREAAIAELRSRGLAVDTLRAEPMRRQLARRLRERRSAWTRVLPGSWPVRTGELVLLYRSLSAALTAGVPLDDALSQFTGDSTRRRLRDLVSAVRAEVVEGMSLSEALRRHAPDVGEVSCSMIEAGTAGGQLDLALANLAQMFETRLRLQRKFWQAALQPLITLVVTMIVLFVMALVIAPSFERVYEEFEADLPTITTFVVSACRSIAANVFAVPVAVIACVGAYLAARRSQVFRMARDRVLLRLPIYGQVTRDAVIGRAVSVLANAQSVGVPLLASLRLAGSASGNCAVAAALERVRVAVADGSLLHQALGGEPLMPPSLRHVVRMGELSGTLAESLQRYVAGHAEIAQSSADRRVVLTELAMILGIGIIVLCVLLVLYLPVFNLANLT